jgi:hypothetical protein
MAATPENICENVFMTSSENDSENSVGQNDRYADSKIYVLWCEDEHFYIGSTIESLGRRLARHKQDSKIFTTRKVYAHINTLGWDCVNIQLIEAFSCNSRKELLEKENEYICSLIQDINCLNEKAAHTTAEELLAYQAAYRQEYHDKIMNYKRHYRKEQAEKIAAYNKQYVADHAEEVSQRKKVYNEKNKEQIAAKCKTYAETHKEEIANYKKKYAEEHAEEIKTQRKQFREANKEKLAEKGREYYEEKKEIILEKNRKYQKENKEKLAKQQKEYREKKKELNLDAPKVCEVCGGSYQDYRKKRHESSKKHQDAMKQ